MGAYNFAVFGLMTGVAIRAKKDRELRQTAIGASMSGLLGGISEPSMYGVVLRYKRVIPIILVPAVIGGATISMLGVKSYAFAFTSLLSIPAMQPSYLIRDWPGYCLLRRDGRCAGLRLRVEGRRR